jgi:hypothetical protein
MTDTSGAREVVARAMAGPKAATDWKLWLDDADDALAALAPIIAAEIQAWADLGFSAIATRKHPVDQAARLVLETLTADADAIASRICGGEA